MGKEKIMHKNFNIIRVEENRAIEKSDIVASEYPLTIYINEEEFITLLCSPKSLDFLAIGFLISEGIIKAKRDVDKIKIDYDRGIAYLTINREFDLVKKLSGKRAMVTGCGKGTIFYNVIDSFNAKKIINTMTIKSKFIIKTMKEFNKKSEMFLKTGGVHSCCLTDLKGIIAFHEDVGRHNALDKIIGECFMKEISLEDKIIFTSGRISSEILLKCAKAKIPAIVSRSAPTNLAIELARQLGITLVGFVRGNRFNIYSGEEKIIVDQ